MFPYKPSIWGYPHDYGNPHMMMSNNSYLFTGETTKQQWWQRQFWVYSKHDSILSIYYPSFSIHLPTVMIFYICFPHWIKNYCPWVHKIHPIFLRNNPLCAQIGCSRLRFTLNGPFRVRPPRLRWVALRRFHHWVPWFSHEKNLHFSFGEFPLPRLMTRKGAVYPFSSHSNPIDIPLYIYNKPS